MAMDENNLINAVQQMNESRKAGVPAYNWIPREWTDPSADPPPLGDTATKKEKEDFERLKIKFEQKPLRCNRTAEKHVGEDVPDEPQKGHEDKFKEGFHKWVHPDSDFDHDDPPLWNDADLKDAREKLHPDQFKRLKSLVGRESLGMQRLACVFEWTLCKATKLLAEVNEALGVGRTKSSPNHEKYQNARNAYIAFLKDLDDHEPQVKGVHVVPGEPGQSGYGKAIKWAYIYPIISGGRILGAKVSVQWNPHSSSNGIPIPHT